MAVDLTLTVDEARAKRHEAGILKYRQDPAGPYVGDPVECAYEEALDLLNYLEAAESQGRIKGSSSFVTRLAAVVELADLLLEKLRREKQ